MKARVEKKKPVETKMIRQNGTGLNKTEADFLNHLMASSHPASPICVQAITLKLANGVRYTPDFVIWDGNRMTAYETKGFLRDDASVKIKVAAGLYPWVSFILVWRVKGQWHMQTVIP